MLIKKLHKSNLIKAGIISLFCTQLLGLTQFQEDNIIKASKISQKIKAKDGKSFPKIISSIMGQESSFGIHNIGDSLDENNKPKELWYCSLGAFQLKVSTALNVIHETDLKNKYTGFNRIKYSDGVKYSQYVHNNNRMLYYEKIIDNKIWLKRYANHDKKAIKTLTWASNKFKKHRDIHKKLSIELKNHIVFIDKLLNNVEFGAEIASKFIVLNYESAKYTCSNPVDRAISKYNGGLHNTTYVNKIKKTLSSLEKNKL